MLLESTSRRALLDLIDPSRKRSVSIGFSSSRFGAEEERADTNYTTAIDTNLMRVVMASVSDIIVTRSLNEISACLPRSPKRPLAHEPLHQTCSFITRGVAKSTFFGPLHLRVDSSFNAIPCS